MASTANTSSLPPILHAIAGKRELLVPLAFLALLGVLVVPLPAMLLDLLICTNIALAAGVLLTTIQMKRPLEFSVFPALLLATTLFRLVLNVASTRLILSAEGSSGEELKGVAGHVIDAFASFVAGNDAIVGGIIFLILIVVQFVVITKGATRMSEVAARFTLDAMPGKQMAIDADLSAGLINETEAKDRREEVTREADFYGAMDGASKFVRGDAIAGIVITLVNIIGGVAIGVLDNGLDAGTALRTFGLLAIGDGLVSQIPAFVVAIAAGLIVARAGGGKAIGDAIPSQLVSQPAVLFLIAIFLGMLAFTGLPSLPMLTAAGALSLLGLLSIRGSRRQLARAAADARRASEEQAEPTTVDDLLGVHTLQIELGYSLVQLVDPSRGGDLVARIESLREQLAVELGIVLPPVQIRDNIQLSSEQYRLRIRGAAVAEGVVHPGMVMAMDSGVVTAELEGVRELEPVFGLEAIWIDPAQRARAENANYIVSDAAGVLLTHLNNIAKSHADELLTREEVCNLIEKLKEKAPKLVEEAVPTLVKPGEVQKVLQALLREAVPIRDLETVLETLSDWSQHTKDPEVLVEYVRNALRRTICSQYAESDEQGGGQKLHCVMLDPGVEDQLGACIERSVTGTTLTVPPALHAAIGQSAVEAVRPLVAEGRRPLVVAGPSVRSQLRQVLEPYLSDVVVLGSNEVIPGVSVESVGLIELDQGSVREVAEPPLDPAPAVAEPLATNSG
ncbi:MAG: flagellar biosynthesis protein FlhA [Planctomycetota bacterium]|nr:flagellar biosynthesis protein FlhA [Planctomycetota bacterium]